MTVETSNGRGPGRPTKLTPKVIANLCAALEDGMPQKGACIAAGIAVSTLAEWREADPTITERMEEARERARRQALQSVKKAALAGDWRAAAEFLKLMDSTYRTSAKIDVTGRATVSGVVFTEEERQRHIERRKILLASLVEDKTTSQVESTTPVPAIAEEQAEEQR